MTKSELETELEEVKQELADEIDMRKDAESDLKELEEVENERDIALDEIEGLKEDIKELKTEHEYVKFYDIIYGGI